MKLSQAIRLGAMQSTQARGAFTRTRRKYFFGLIGPKVLETCALGAAYMAENGGSCKIKKAERDHNAFRGRVASGDEVAVMETPDDWPLSQWATCPVCDDTKMMLYRLIPHLNDDHAWNRGQIATFVERYEPDSTTAMVIPGPIRIEMDWSPEKSPVSEER